MQITGVNINNVVCVCLFVCICMYLQLRACMLLVGSIFLVKRLSLKVPQIEKHKNIAWMDATAHDVASCAVYEKIKFVLIAGSYILSHLFHSHTIMLLSVTSFLHLKLFAMASLCFCEAGDYFLIRI
jgi:hypothetical protein